MASSLRGNALPPEPLQSTTTPVLILGGGVGALTAALYISRAGMTALVVEGDQPGGLLMQSASVQNWPGERDIIGSELVEKMRRQAVEHGAQFLSERVIRVDFSQRPFRVITLTPEGKERSLEGDACIIAMGTEPRRLGVAGEEVYWGKGVSSCAICDGSLYHDEVVGVVGGGDAAVLEALYLSNLAKKVHVFVRGDSLKATDQQRIAALQARPNVEIHDRTLVTEVSGNGTALSGVKLQSGERHSSLALRGLFLAIGSNPNSSLFRGILDLDSAGYIVVDADQQTSLPGVYAVGDIADPAYQQAISAAGDGAKAALEVQAMLAQRAALHSPNVQAVKDPQDILSQVVEIQSLEEFEQVLHQGDLPLVVDFYATWCPPCKRLAPYLDSSAEHLEGKVKFIKVDVERLRGLSRSYHITSMPTLLFFSVDGRLTDRKEGTEEIAAFLHRLETEPSP